jgi:hypothetical protein
MAEPKFTEAQFDAEILRRTGCTWEDLGGDEEGKEDWMNAEDTAQDCVTAYITKYDLDDLDP